MTLGRCSTFALTLVVAAAAAAMPCSAFVGTSQDRTARSTTSTRLFGNTKQAPTLLPEVKDLEYGEESRKYRRTVFSHDDWRKFRDPDRFGYYLYSLTSSGIYKNLAREVSATTAIAMFIVAFNAMVGGYTDFEGVNHAALVSTPWLPVLGLPLAPFNLATPALGLLLGK
jgi:ion channel-forming bestrophin family protein